MTDPFRPPPNVVGILSNMGASKGEIDNLRATYSEEALKKAIRVVEGNANVIYKVPYLFRVLKEKVPLIPTTMSGYEEFSDFIDPTRAEEWAKTSRIMLDLSMAPKSKLDRIRKLLMDNIMDDMIFPLPQVTKEKMLKEIENDNNLINPRVVLGVKLLLKHLGKRFEEDF